MTKPFSPHLRRLAVFSGIWLVVVFFFAGQIQIETEASWGRAVRHSFFRWVPWMLFTPAIFFLAGKLPLEPTGWIRNGLVHVVASIAITMLAALFFEKIFKPGRNSRPHRPEHAYGAPGPVRPAMEGPRRRGGPPPPGGRPNRPGPRGPDRNRPPGPRSGPPGSHSLWKVAVGNLQVGLPVYWAILGIQSGLLFNRRLRQRERQAMELEAKLTNARLEALKLQLQPHFLFNALNAVSTLLHRDQEKADEMIGHLSILLRSVLDEGETNEVLLSRELELLDAYLSIEKTRFGSRMEFALDICPECTTARVPLLLLQPLVENAVRHGLEPKSEPGTIWLSARKVEDRLHILIEDDGVGRGTRKTKGWGIGLSNARARLEGLCGVDGYQLEITDREGGGTRVAIDLPFLTES
ncbi:MAG: histidine kinase [Verrucomicrobiota bacterium]